VHPGHSADRITLVADVLVGWLWDDEVFGSPSYPSASGTATQMAATSHRREEDDL